MNSGGNSGTDIGKTRWGAGGGTGEPASAGGLTDFHGLGPPAATPVLRGRFYPHWRSPTSRNVKPPKDLDPADPEKLPLPHCRPAASKSSIGRSPRLHKKFPTRRPSSKVSIPSTGPAGLPIHPYS